MTKVKQTLFILTLVILGLTSCNNSSQQNASEKKTVATETIPTKTELDNETIVQDSTFFPDDSTFSTKVLTLGTFHSDEVGENANQIQWFGLFNGSKGYYLKQTKIETTNVNDPVLDESENEKTGWEVQVVNKDTCLILIEPIPFLKDRDIRSVKLSKNEIYPGDEVSFQYLEVDYKIYATGNKKKIQDDQEGFEVSNYKLYLTATIKGKQHTSLLVAQPNFDDRMINLIFAGDIDGDDILDLIIDTSRHYNVTSPTIYLSRSAENEEVVKPIGGHTSVGC